MRLQKNINNFHNSFNLLISLLALTSGNLIYAHSPWISTPNEFNTTVSYTFESFSNFWRGNKKATLANRIEQETVSLDLDYAFTPEFSLDLRLGYAKSDANGTGSDGLIDTHVGLKWLLLNEFTQRNKFLPTLTFRSAIIIEGTYDVGVVSAIGDGASGINNSILIGKSLTENFGLFSSINYKIFNHKVPNQISISAGLYQNIIDKLSVNLVYSFNKASSGISIDDPLFNPSRFPELNEISHNAEASLSYIFSKNKIISFLVARTLDGENTGQKTIFSFSFSNVF